jgi:hypothetical protein
MLLQLDAADDHLLMFPLSFGMGIKAGFLLPNKIDSISIQFIE